MKIFKFDWLVLPLIGVGAVLLWQISAATWANELPSPLRAWHSSKPYIVESFAKRGEMDQGILRVTLYSLILVAKGCALALLIGTPIGFCLGLSRRFARTFDPIIQVLRPVSPLAWLLLGLVLFLGVGKQASELGALCTIAICAMWPTVMNPAVGVRAIPHDCLSVAKVLIPSALPSMFTGFRLRLGIAWLVIVAAEMLAQNPGLGKFVWDMFQNGSSQTLAQIMLAVFTIGFIGLILDRTMMVLQRTVSFDANAIH